MQSFFRNLVRMFLTGVATLLPLIVTVFVVTWVVKLADAYIGPSSSFGMFIVTVVGESKKYIGYLAGYLVVIIFTIVLGFLVTRATISRIHSAVDRMFARIPLVGKIYAGVGQVVELLGKKNQNGLERFGGVGYVRMGNVKILGLLTSTEHYVLEGGKEHVLVFVPNAPIPATGFTVLAPVEDFEPLNIPVEDLAKLLMSLGSLGPQVLNKPSDLIAYRMKADESEATR